MPVILALALAAAASPDAGAFARNTLRLKSFKLATTDLNGDGKAEALIYDQGSCGSGGCTLYVLTPNGAGYRVVSRTAVSQLPVRVMNAKGHGWRDIGVNVCGGGITACHEVRLRFDGSRYPGNPTVPPAAPMRIIDGKVLIAK